jgi:putative FmdB family regulatory protein
MPRYDFSCAVCGVKFERQVSYHSDLGSVTCPNSHSQVRRLYSVPSVVFKGSGWYVTDHRRGTGKTAQTESG